MQLVEAGELSLDDLAADRLPPRLEFDTNGARIVDLLSMRSGISEYFVDEADFRKMLSDPMHVWTLVGLAQVHDPDVQLIERSSHPHDSPVLTVTRLDIPTPSGA